MDVTGNGVRPVDHETEGWWTGLEDELLASLGSRGAASPAEIAECLGMSERAVCSVVSLLAAEGKVRITRIEVISPQSV
jgi:hypothetical protein